MEEFLRVALKFIKFQILFESKMTLLAFQSGDGVRVPRNLIKRKLREEKRDINISNFY